MKTALCVAATLVVSLTAATARAQSAPEFVLQVGHFRDVKSVAFSPDGSLLASASIDRTLKLWDTSSGKLRRTLLHPSGVFAVCFLDTETLATGSNDDGTIRIWSAITGTLLRSIQLPETSSVISVACSPDRRTLAVASLGNRVSFVDADAGTLLYSQSAHSSYLAQVAFSPDGRTLVSVGWYGGDVKLWDVASRRIVRTLDAQTVGKSLSVAFSRDGKILAFGGWDGIIVLVDAASQQPLRHFESQEDRLLSLAFSPDGRWLATADPERKVRIRDVQSGAVLQTLEESQGAFSVAFSPAGGNLAFADRHSNVKIWAPASHNPLRSFRGGNSHISSFAFFPNGQTLVAAGADGRLTFWDSSSGKIVHRWPADLGYRSSVAVSPDGTQIASRGRDGSLRFWDRYGYLESSIARGGDIVAFLPDGKGLVSINGDMVEVQSLGPMKLRFSRKGTSAAVSRDGQLLATGNADQAQIWDLSGKLLQTLESPTSGGEVMLGFSPDAGKLATAQASSVQVWDTSSGKLLHRLAGYSSPIEAGAFSSDGRLFAAGCDRTIYLWDVASGKPLHVLEGHLDLITSVAFSPDGKLLASGSFDGSLRFWNPADGMPLAVSYAFHDEDFLTYTPEGYYVASEGADAYATWRIDGQTYWVKQYAEYSRRPDLVRQRLAGKSIPALDFLPAVDLTPQLAAASITFLHTTGQHTLSEKLLLQFQVESLNELAVVSFSMANEPPKPMIPVQTNSENGRTLARYEVPVELTEGANHFQVAAVTREGIRSEEGVSIVRDPVHRLWVAAFGVSLYNDPAIEDLDFADDDAQAVYDYYKSVLGLPEDHLFLRTDGEVTLRELKSLMGTQLGLRVQGGDTVILYFAGHGIADDDAASRDPDGTLKYFLPSEANPHEPFATALGLDELTERILPRLKAERVIVILDSCFSGAAGGRTLIRKGLRAAPLTEEFLDRIAQAGKGQVILAASEANGVAREDPSLGHGVFTYYLIEGLRGKAERGDDGAIDVVELYDYVWPKVFETTKQRQKPVIWAPSFLEGKIIVGRPAPPLRP